MRTSRRSRGQKEKRQKSTTVVHEQEKDRAYEKKYVHVNRIAKKSIKAYKREHMQATETEEATQQGNLREQYTTINKLSGKLRKPEKPVRDKGEACP